MPRTTLWGLGATVAAVTLLPIDATATYVTGSYEGTVQITSSIPQPDGPPVETIEYAPIWGSFAFETDIGALPSPPLRDPEIGDDFAIYYGLPTRMEFNYQNFTEVYDNETDAFGGPRLEVRGVDGRQHLLLDVSGPYWYATMDFVGSLFNDVSPLLFDPQFIDVAASTAIFSGDIRHYGNGIEFSRIAFDGYGSHPIPTPGTGALLLIGAGAMLLGRRRRPSADPGSA